MELGPSGPFRASPLCQAPHPPVSPRHLQTMSGCLSISSPLGKGWEADVGSPDLRVQGLPGLGPLWSLCRMVMASIPMTLVLTAQSRSPGASTPLSLPLVAEPLPRGKTREPEQAAGLGAAHSPGGLKADGQARAPRPAWGSTGSSEGGGLTVRASLGHRGL